MRKLTAVLSTFALAVTLGACGEKGDDAANNNSGGEAAANNLVALAQQVGDSAAETSTAHMVFTGDFAGQKISGEGDLEVGPDEAAMTMDMSTPEGNVGFVFLDGVMYLQTGQEVEPGKSWIKIDPKGDDPMAKALGGISDEMRKNVDPRATLELLKNAGTITSQEENVEVNGEQTTHYKITLDVAKLTEMQTQDENLKKAIEQTGIKEFPVELWVNEDDLPVRFTMDMAMTDPQTNKAVTAKMQVDYTKWGEPVEITAPPADQVAEFPAN